MRKPLTLIRSLSSLLMIFVASTWVVAAVTWSGDVKIRTIVADEGKVFVNFNNLPFNTQCRQRDGNFFIGGSSENVERMTALATQALLKSRNVQVGTDGSCSSDGYPVLLALTLK